MSGNIPVDIDFVLKNVNFEAEAAKMKKEILDVGATTEKVADQVEQNFTEAFTRAGAAAAKTDAAFGNAGAGAAKFAKGNQQLSFSMQQVARELPSLAISPQMFMLAISNNLPILQDQIRKTRIENEALKASGISTVPVWRQLVSSLLSWQTALVAGITIFTVYGKEIFGWIGNLLKSKDALEQAKKAANEYTAATQEGLKKAQDELTTLELLYEAATNSAKGMSERNAAVNELQRIYPDYLGNIDDELIKTGDAVTAYENLRRAIMDAAVAKAYAGKITEAQTKLIELEEKRVNKIAEINKAHASTTTLKTTPGGSKITFGFGNIKAGSGQKELKEIEAEMGYLKKQIERYAGSINITDLLYGGVNKPGKIKKELDELNQAEDALTKAVIAGDQKEIDFLAAKVALLRAELELRKWIAEEAIAFANGKVTQAQRDSVMNPTAIAGKTPDKNYVGATKIVKGVWYEIKAINKTGPVWKEIGRESDKIYKQIKENAKKAAKDQDELDREALENKEKLYNDLLNAAQMLTHEMLQQLNLTRDQEEVLSGIATALMQLAQGNPIGAAASYLTTLIKAIASTKGLTPEEMNESQLQSINKSVERTNQLLDYQLNILTGLDGSDWFSSAVKSLIDLNRELTGAKRKLSEIKVYQSGGGRFGAVDTSKWTQEQWVKALSSTGIGGFSFDGLEQGAKEYLDLWIEIENKIKTIENEQKTRLLGFSSTDIATNIASGIINGLKLAENGLGGFAESFGDLMEAYGRKSLETFINEKYLNDLYEQAYSRANDEEGLSDIDLQELEKLYAAAAKGGQEYYDRISKLFSYGNTPEQKGLTGITTSLTEDTGSLIVGQFNAIRVDIKEILKNMAAGDDMVVQNLAYMKEIAENTRHNVRLKAVEEGITETNRILRERL